MEFNDVQDLAQHFSQLVHDVPYPDRYELPAKPERKNFPNHQSYGKALDEWEAIEKQVKEEFRIKKRQYDHNVSEIEEKFKKALLDHLGISKHKKADKLYSMAWDRGHGSGYGEVALIAGELAELISQGD